MRLGILTGGGDCPGLNAVIRAVVRRAEDGYGHDVVGILDGWQGLFDLNTVDLSKDACRGILPRGGTILGTSRTDPSRHEAGWGGIKTAMAGLQLDGLIVVGGDGTLRAALEAHQLGIRVVGVPKTIDNDIGVTETTFGFHTAVQIVTDAIDRLHTTAESHDRVMVLEVMGRSAGWIALQAGIAGGAAVVMIPEVPLEIGVVAEHLRYRHNSGRWASVVVVAEGVSVVGARHLEHRVDEFGRPRFGGIGEVVSEEISALTGFETRVTNLGYVQRGGSPVAFDRVLGSRFGIAAVDAAAEHEWGCVVVAKGEQIVRWPIAEVAGNPKLVDPDYYWAMVNSLTSFSHR